MIEKLRVLDGETISNARTCAEQARHAMSCILGTDWAGRVDTEPVTAATKIERSGRAIRATLTELAPAECTEFEAEFSQALAHADADFDLGHVDAVLDRWWGIAAMCANPLTRAGARNGRAGAGRGGHRLVRARER